MLAVDAAWAHLADEPMETRPIGGPTFEDPEETRDRAAGALNRHNAVEMHPEGRGGPGLPPAVGDRVSPRLAPRDSGDRIKMFVGMCLQEGL